LKNAQTSFEYILLVAIVMLFVVGGVGMIYSYIQRSNDDIKGATIEKIGNEMIETVEKVYYVGGDSWQTIKINIPAGIRGMYVVNNNELVIAYESYSGISESIFYSDVNMTTPYGDSISSNVSSALHAGFNSIRISAQGSNVSIEEVT
jgi:hypothetical protein